MIVSFKDEVIKDINNEIMRLRNLYSLFENDLLTRETCMKNKCLSICFGVE
jgi:RecA/RadA recombinase